MSTSSSLAPVWRRARLSYERAHARARRHQRRYWAGVAVIAVVSGTLVDRLGAPPPGAPPPSPAAATPTGPPSSGGLAERLTPGTRAVALPRTGADLPVVAGDRVDVITADARGARAAATGVAVLAAGDDAVVVAVPEAAVADLAAALATGRVSLALRPAPTTTTATR